MHFCSSGQFFDVRLAALECLVDYVRVDGSFGDIMHLLDIIENDPVPLIRHKTARLMIENPPFDRARQHRNDREQLADRLWDMMK